MFECEHTDVFVPCRRKFKSIPSRYNWDSYIRNRSQPFPLPHYCGICDLPGFDSEAQRNDSIPEYARGIHVVSIAVGTPVVDCTGEKVEMAIRE